MVGLVVAPLEIRQPSDLERELLVRACVADPLADLHTDAEIPLGSGEISGELALVGSTISYGIGAVYARAKIRGLRPMIPAVFQVGFAFVIVSIFAFINERPLDVAWNIDALLPAAGDAGVDELLDAATAKATGLEAARGTIATMDAGELATFMHGLEAIAELVGRAGNYVHLAVDGLTTG